MKTLMKYACPVMMLGFPSLIFAADTLRQLNAKSKGVMSGQVLPRGMRSGAACYSELDGISAVGSVYKLEGQLYRCVTVFDDRYQPLGNAWIEVKKDNNEIALQADADF